ncbi:uncharacterized protein LOC121560644 isoform X2 [Coregonus clupeaformis]|uniref:uncharacterized protein LOC121560644 isoform X2 n=1 Tax=Coregonus clupeaformis TaxID=59861 RepID=UPI001E1C78E6|nr:uncharacterized protein LOC121560644 isoform X2 [Coregonus clupeaformis]
MPHCCNYDLAFTGSRSSSPESVTSDIEFSGFSLEELFADYRADSAESIYSDNEFLDQLEAGLVPLLHESASPVSDPLLHSTQSETSVNKLISPALVQSESEHRDTKPEILVSTTTMAKEGSVEAQTTLPVAAKKAFIQLDLSDEKFGSLLPVPVLMPVKQEPANYLDEVEEDNLKHQDISEVKPLSPESVFSDSVSQFRPGHCDYYLVYNVSSSVSPQSVTSDIEYHGLYRPGSPSDSELIVTVQSSVSEHRPLSPESITSEDNYSFLELLFSESRPSSPESVASFDEYMPLSPESPVPHFMPQCCDYLAFTGSRCSSPESVSSGIEFSEFCLEELFAEERADSPESLISESEIVESVEGGLMKFRPLSPESITSEDDYTFLELLFAESRPSSPHSITSTDEYRSLSPDSPIPQFRPTIIELSMSFLSRSPSPISVTSDFEGSGFYLEEPFNEERPDSPESFISESEFVESVEKGVMQLRPLSPESVTTEDDYSFLELLLSESRPSSPESVASFDEYRPLSPDSPVPDFRPHCCDYYLLFTEDRSSSPESVSSDIEFSGLYLKELFAEDRADSPESIYSDNEFLDQLEAGLVPLLLETASPVSDPLPHSTQSETSVNKLISPALVQSESEHRDTKPEILVSTTTMAKEGSVEAQTTLPVAAKKAFIQLDLSDEKFGSLLPVPVLMPVKQEPANSLDEVEEDHLKHQDISEVKPLSPESVFSDSVSQFRPGHCDYYLLYSGRISPIPESVTTFDDHRPLSPDSPASQFRPGHCDYYLVYNVNSSVSPQSVTSDIEYHGLYRPGSPSDSELIVTVQSSVSEHRPLSPESITSEDDYSFLELLFSESRPSSPESVASFDEYRPLSPDSPVPHFMPQCCDYLAFTGSRCSSPESVSSGIEISEFCLEELFAEERADSPESLISESEIVESVERGLMKFRPLSPESITSEDDYTFLELLFAESRPSSPHSITSTDEYQSLSPDSPIPQFRPTIIELSMSFLSRSPSPISVTSDFEGSGFYLEELFNEERPDSPESFISESEFVESVEKGVMKLRPLSPESVTSEDDYSFLELLLSESRPSSPESVASFDEYRPLSPDSPVPHFMPQCCDYLAFTGSRSSSPESVTSDVEFSGFSLEELFAEERADSPESLISESEIVESVEGGLMKFRPLSPESITSEGDFTFLELLLSESRPSSPESVASFDEYRPLSPDSPVPDFRPHCCDYYLLFTEDRSSSPQSVTSDIEFSGFSFKELFAENRAYSPYSCMSESESVESVELGVISQRSLSPESVTSEDNYSFLELLLSESRPSSPESVTSFDEYRTLSPDSPVPHFMPQCCDNLAFTGSRCSSPESVSSGIEFSEFCLEELFAEERADSPESLISESDIVESVERGLMKFRPLSPESITSEDDYSILELLLSESRPSSPESVVSFDENRPLSPDSPVPHFMPQCCDYDLAPTGSRCSSPESVSSDIEFSGLYLKELIAEDRADSPESIYSDSDFLDQLEAGLVPLLHESASPVSDHLPHSTQSETSVNKLISPALVQSESEHRDTKPEILVSTTTMAKEGSVEVKTTLPVAAKKAFIQLDLSDEKFCSLLPVTVLMPVKQEPANSLDEVDEDNLKHQDISEVKPLSPESVFSDSVSQFRPGHCNYYLLYSGSISPIPESVTTFDDHRPLSPDSPASQFRPGHCDYYLVYNVSSSMSPQSVTSDIEYHGLYRPGSQSDSELIVTVQSSVSEHRPLSPESVTSEDDYSFLELLLSESRPSSPESVASFDEYRPLSPDSPVPHFMPQCCDYYLAFTGSRCSSPESVSSGIEFSEFCLEELFAEERADSPESFISESEIVESVEGGLMKFRPLSPESITSEDDYTFLELLLSESRPSSPHSITSTDEYRSLSPDSPIPQFRTTIIELSMSFLSRSPSPISVTSDFEGSGFYLEELFNEERPDSPESFISESEFVESVEKGVMKLRPVSPESITSEDDYSFLELLLSESRPSSPESVASFDESRPLSPDSPVPDFRPHCCDYYLLFKGDRSSSPQSVTSDIEFSRFSLKELFAENRAYSPDSCMSESESVESVELGVISQRSLSPESITSEDDYSFLELLLSESRPSSPESVASFDEYRPLSPDSPVPDFRPQYCDYYLLFTADSSSSPESVSSDLEYSGSSLEELFTEDRPNSPISIWSEGGDHDDDDGSFPKTSGWDDDAGPPEEIPTVHWAIIPQFMVSKAVQTGLSTDTDEFSSLPEVRPVSPEYRLVYKAVPIKRMSHMYDPAYEGETCYSKTGVFEHSVHRQKVRQALDCQRELCGDFRPVHFSESNHGMPSVSETSAVEVTEQDISSLKHSNITDQTVTETFHEPHLPISQPVETEIRTPSPVLAEWEFVQLSSLPEYRPLSPESLGSDRDGILLYLDHFFTDMRPSSPESVASANEYWPLSPESPVPHYGPRILDVITTAERRSSLYSVTSDIELFGLCLEESFAEDRADSPDSFNSEGEYEQVDETLTKSGPLSAESSKTEDEYAHSFIQYWLSELQPSSADPMTSLDELQPSSVDPMTSLDELQPSSVDPMTSLDELQPSSADPMTSLDELDAAETSSSTEIDDSEAQPIYKFSDGKTLTPVPSKLMAQTFDPAHKGETFLNKSGVFECAGDRQVREIMERLKDKEIVLGRPITPESITSEEIRSFLNDWSTELELRPNSIESLDEYRPLSPDSPIPQFLHQCCDYYLELPGDRSQSPLSVTSDIEYCGSYLNELIPEHRPDSPDSFLADSEFKESIEQFFMKLRPLSPKSVTSEDDYTFLDLLFSESRPYSPESVTSLDEDRPLSPDSPIPQFLHQYCGYYLVFPADRSSSPESVTSDIEFSEFCLDELFAEDRADSPDSFISEGHYEQLDETLTKSGPLSAESSKTENEYAHSFIQYWLSELQPSPADPMTSLHELDAAETSSSTEMDDSESQPIYEFSGRKKSTLEYRLVYKAVPSTLMAHTLDPAYKGETYFTMTGVFEYAGDRLVRKVLDQPQQSGEDLRPVSVGEPASPCHSATPEDEETVLEGSILTVPHVTDQTVTETLQEPHFPISQPVETEIRTTSPVLAEWEFIQLSYLPEYRPLSPESLGSDSDGVLLYLDHFFTDMRPSSPESVASFDEYRPLSPDSPVPHFMPQCCDYYLAPTGDRSSSPQSVTSGIEFSEFCLEELFAEERADSPESLISEDGTRLVDESDKDMSQDPDSTSEESLSFLEDWFSELDLRPSSPESVASQEEYRPLSPDSPVPQYGPGLSVFTVSAGQRCSTPESVISDWDEFGLEDLFCETRAFSPDSIRSDTDTVLTQGDGQHYPPTDQVSTEHQPEMTVERARLKQPPELTWAPFRLVFPVVYQTHRAVEAFFCRASSPDSHREPVDDVDLDRLDDVETHRPHQASSQSSHMPSDEQNLGSPVAAVGLEEAVHQRPQASRKSIQRKEHSNVPTLKGSEVQPKMEETSKHLKRKAMRKEEDSRVSAASVSAGSSMENLSEPKHVSELDQPYTNRPISNKTLMSETYSGTPDLQIPNAFEFSPLSPEMTMPTEKMRVLPESPEKPLKLNKESSSSETSPVLPDILSHTSEDSQGDEAGSSASNPRAPPESGAHAQLDQLLSELEDIKPELRPETPEPLDSPLSKSSKGGPVDLQPYVEFEELLPESDGNPTEGEEEISSPVQITGEPAEISAAASVLTHLSLSHETDPEVFGVTVDLVKTFPEPDQVTADPVQLSHLESLQTHRAEESDLTGSMPLVSPAAAIESVGTSESPEPCHKVLELSSESIVPTQEFRSPEPCHKVLELSSESIVPTQEFRSLQHDEAAYDSRSSVVFDEPSTVEEHQISHPQQDQETVDEEYSNLKQVSDKQKTFEERQIHESVDEEYANFKETSSIQAAVVKASIEQSNVLCESGGLTTEPSQLVDEPCMSNTPEVVSHLRDRTPPETLEYDEWSPQSLSDVTPQTPETVTASAHFSFDELSPYQSPRYLNMLSEELETNTSEQPSEDPVTPVEEESSPPVTPVEVKSPVSQPGPVEPRAEMVSAQPGPVEPRAEMVSAQPGPGEPRAEMVSAQPGPEVAASAHDEEIFMEFIFPPKYTETSSSSSHKPKPPTYTEVIRGSTTMHLYEDSDPETYFDCKQGVSDFSETEPDELKKGERSGVGRTRGQASHSGALGRKYQKPTALPGCSDDIKEESEELAHSPVSAFYQAPQELPPRRAADDDDSLDRADEMTDIPPQTPTEEQYTDEHGHAVFRKVMFSERESDSVWGRSQLKVAKSAVWSGTRRWRGSGPRRTTVTPP